MPPPTSVTLGVATGVEMAGDTVMLNLIQDPHVMLNLIQHLPPPISVTLIVGDMYPRRTFPRLESVCDGWGDGALRHPELDSGSDTSAADISNLIVGDMYPRRTFPGLGSVRDGWRDGALRHPELDSGSDGVSGTSFPILFSLGYAVSETGSPTDP